MVKIMADNGELLYKPHDVMLRNLYVTHQRGDFHGMYPLVMFDVATENGPVEIVDLPTKHGDFPVRYVCLPKGNQQKC